MNKQCRNCKESKPLTEFFKDKGLLDGRANTCKLCKQEQTYAWREKNKDKYNKSMRDYQAANPLQRDNCDLKRKYGVSRPWFDETLKQQNNRCAICEKENPSKKRRLVVDHHHKNKLVRGIICYNCNRLLHAFDNLELYKKILAYLEKYK